MHLALRRALIILNPHAPKELSGMRWEFLHPLFMRAILLPKITLQLLSFCTSIQNFLPPFVHWSRHAQGGTMSRMLPRRTHESSLLKYSLLGKLPLAYSIRCVVRLRDCGMPFAMVNQQRAQFEACGTIEW